MPSAASLLEKIENPWLRAFLAADWQEIAIAQVVVRRVGKAFELRHAADRDAADLKPLRAPDARSLAAFNDNGEFRPLKATPDLKSGWIIRADTPDDLADALQHIYPNALADRFALTQSPPPITDYRAFTARQSGMYRITSFLADSDLARVVNNVCGTICLKQRLWTAPNIPPDREETKSLVPCLEPCAILLEAARKEVRALQEKDRASTPPP